MSLRRPSSATVQIQVELSLWLTRCVFANKRSDIMRGKAGEYEVGDSVRVAGRHGRKAPLYSLVREMRTKVCLLCQWFWVKMLFNCMLSYTPLQRSGQCSDSKLLSDTVQQGCTSPGRHIAVATTFATHPPIWWWIIQYFFFTYISAFSVNWPQ
jgi:hypothetical protein